MKIDFEKVLTVAFGVLLVSLLLFWYETKEFKYSTELPKDYKMTEKEIYFTINDDEMVCITNNYTNKNILIKTDSTLENEIKVVYSYIDSLDVYYTRTFNSKDKTRSYVNFEGDIRVNKNLVENSFDLLYGIMKDDTFYNYGLLKYTKVIVYVHPDYVGQIKLNDGKTNFCKLTSWKDIKWY